MKALYKTLWLLAFCYFLPDLSAQDKLTELYYSGDYKQVIELSSRQIESGDTSVNAYYLKALAESQFGQTGASIATLQEAMAIHPDNARLLRMIAVQYFEAGDYVRAERSYKLLVQGDNTDVSSWLKLADIASFRQHNDKAIEALNQVLRIDSINLTGLMKMGDILHRHNSDAAILFYQDAFTLNPDNQNAAYAVGNLYIQYKEAWKTIPICEDMLRLDTTSIKFSKLLGYAYYKTGDPHTAVKYFEYANQLGDSTAFAFKFKGISHYLRTDFESSVTSLQIATEKDSLDAEIHFFLGASLATTKAKTKAMYHLNKSLKLMQPDPSIISRIYSEQGNIKRLEMEYEEAFSLYEQAWEADTSNAMSLYFMASILDNSMRKSKEALVVYQRYLDALDNLPEKEESTQGVSVRSIVEDRIVTLKEEIFFLDE